MITREMLRDIRIEGELALAAIAKKHGVVITLGRATFSQTEAKFAMQVATTTAAVTAAIADGVQPKDAKAAQDYTNLAGAYGMKAEWLGRAFKRSGRSFTVVGLLPNKRKNNVLIEGTGGGRYIMSPEEVIPGFPA